MVKKRRKAPNPQHLLMPRGICLWMLEKTSLTYDQIAEFCSLPILEVEALANNEDRPCALYDPIACGYTTSQQIQEAEQDSSMILKPHIHQNALLSV